MISKKTIKDPASNSQNLLFNKQDIQEDLNIERLNKLIDHTNKRNGINTLGWGSSIIDKSWSPRRDKLSYLKTTTIESIPLVFAN